MSSSSYIRFPIETNPNQLALDVYAYIQARSPQWSPNTPNLDVWLIQAFATLAAELREIASDVPDSIFRYFGATMMSIPPIDATHSSVSATFTVQDTAGYTIPDGTQVAIRDSVGNLVGFVTIGDTIIPSGSTTAVIAMTSIDPGADTAGLGGIGVAAQLLDTLAFVTSIVLTGATTGGVDAEDDTTYLNRLAVELRLLSTRPILPADFAIMTRTQIAGVYRAAAIDGYNPFHNLLTANQASVETDATGWASLLNATVARSTAQSTDGVASLSLTSVAAGDMQAATNPITTVVVNPGETITALASFRSAVTARSCRVSIRWYTAAQVFISQSDGAAANDSAAAWTAYSVTAVAPATTGFARVVVTVGSTGAAAEVHYVDRVSVRRGITTDWVAGGTGETGQPRTIAVAALDVNGNGVSGPIKTAIATLLQANREVNFIVNVMDPTVTQIDVN
jgi:hypothetical protein